MPGYRQAHSRMWSDDWFSELKPEFKLLFFYLFTNERASVSGLYELSLRVIAFETGLEKQVILEGFAAFELANKVYYDEKRSVVFVRNMLKYQSSSSPKVAKRIEADLKSVPECALKDKWLSEYKVSIGYRYGIEKEEYGSDTSSSISISSLISSSSSEEGEGAGEETKQGPKLDWIPVTPREAASHPHIQLYQKITEGFPSEKDYEVIVTTFEFLRALHPDLYVYLMPFWSTWKNGRTKDNKPYSPTSRVWYCEWAMQGRVPKLNGHEPQLSVSFEFDNLEIEEKSDPIPENVRNVWESLGDVIEPKGKMRAQYSATRLVSFENNVLYVKTIGDLSKLQPIFQKVTHEFRLEGV